MPIYRVEGPDGQIYRVEAPEGATEAQIFTFLQAQLQQQAQTAQQAPESGLFAQLKRGAEETVSGLRTGAAGLLSPEEAALAGLRRQEEIGRKYADEVSLDKVREAYEQRGLLSAAGEVATQAPKAIAQQLPNLAGLFAASRAGAMAGSKLGARGTIVGGIGGALGYGFTQAYGSNIERQAAEDVEAGRPLEIEAGKAAAVAAPQAALEAAGPAFALGARLVSRLTGIPAAAMVGERTAAQARKLADERLLGLVTKGTARGVAAEVPTEIGQQILERYQAGLPLTDDDAMKEYGEVAYQTSLLGPIGIAGRVSGRAGAREQVREEEAAVAAQQAEAQRAEAAAAEQAAAQEAETARVAEEAERATPEYAQRIGEEYETKRQQFQDAKKALGKKPPADDPAAQLEYKGKQDALKEMQKELAALAPEYNRTKQIREQPAPVKPAFTYIDEKGQEVAIPAQPGAAPEARPAAERKVERPFAPVEEAPAVEAEVAPTEARATSISAVQQQLAGLEQQLEDNQAAIGEANKRVDPVDAQRLFAERDRLIEQAAVLRQQLESRPETRADNLVAEIAKIDARIRKNIDEGVDPEKARRDYEKRSTLVQQLTRLDPNREERLAAEAAELEAQIARAEQQAEDFAATVRQPDAEQQTLADLDRVNAQINETRQKIEQQKKNLEVQKRLFVEKDPQRALDVLARQGVIPKGYKAPDKGVFTADQARIQAEASQQIEALENTLSELNKQKQSLESALPEGRRRALSPGVIATDIDYGALQQDIQDIAAETETARRLAALPAFREGVVQVPESVRTMPKARAQRIRQYIDSLQKEYDQRMDESAALYAANQSAAAKERNLVAGEIAERLNEIRRRADGGYATEVLQAREQQNVALGDLETLVNDIRQVTGNYGLKFEYDPQAVATGKGEVFKLVSLKEKAAAERGRSVLSLSDRQKLSELEIEIADAKRNYLDAMFREAAAHRKAFGDGVVTQNEALRAALDVDDAVKELVDRLQAEPRRASLEEIVVVPGQMRAGNLVKPAESITVNRAIRNIQKNSAAIKRVESDLLVAQARDPRVRATIQQNLDALRAEQRDLQAALESATAGRTPGRFVKPSASIQAIFEQLENVRDALIAPRKRVAAPQTLRTQFKETEAARVAEATGETATTLGGELRRRTEFVREKMARMRDVRPMAVGVLNEAADVMDAGSANRGLLDAVEPVVDAINDGRLVTQTDLRAIRDALDASLPTVEEARTAGQRELFAETSADRSRRDREVGLIRTTAENFDKSPAVKKGRAAVDKLRAAAVKLEEDRKELLRQDALEAQKRKQALERKATGLIQRGFFVGIMKDQRRDLVEAIDRAQRLHTALRRRAARQATEPEVQQAVQAVNDVEAALIRQQQRLAIAEGMTPEVRTAIRKRIERLRSEQEAAVKTLRDAMAKQIVDMDVAAATVFALKDSLVQFELQATKKFEQIAEKAKDDLAAGRFNRPAYLEVQQALQEQRRAAIVAEQKRLEERRAESIAATRAKEQAIQEAQRLLADSVVDAQIDDRVLRLENATQEYQQLLAEAKESDKSPFAILDAKVQAAYRRLINESKGQAPTAPTARQRRKQIERIAAGQTTERTGPATVIQSAAPTAMRIGPQTGAPAAGETGQRAVPTPMGIREQRRSITAQRNVQISPREIDEANTLAGQAAQNQFNAVKEKYEDIRTDALAKIEANPKLQGAAKAKRKREMLAQIKRQEDAELDAVTSRLLGDSTKDALFSVGATANGGYLPTSAIESLESGSIAGALDAIEQNTSNPTNRAIARRLKLLLGGTRVVLKDTGTLIGPDGKPANGSALLDGTGIELDRVTGMNEHVVLHEATHAAVERVLRLPDSKLTDKQRAAKKELEALYDAVQNDPDFKGEYALDSLSEFVAEALSNEGMQGKMRQKKWTLKAMWDSFKSIILDVLGIDRPQNMLDATLMAAERMMAVVPRATSADFSLATPRAYYAPTMPANAGLAAALEVTDKLVAKQKPVLDRIKESASGLAFETNMVDRFAPLERATKLMDALKGTQVMYYARMYDQRMNFAAQSIANGALQLVTKQRKDGQSETIIESKKGASIRAVAEILKEASGKISGDQASRLFTMYLAAIRAKRVGLNRLNYGAGMTQADLDAAIRSIEDAGLKDVFERARETYNQYNSGLVRFAQEAGVFSKEQADTLLKDSDYVPYYREENGNLLFDIGGATPFKIGNLRDMPHLKDLVGGDTRVLDFTTTSVQNTAMLTDLALNNLATKNAVAELIGINLATEAKGALAGPDIVRYKVDGEDRYARIETDAKGIPADLLVKGMAGIPAQVTGFMRAMALPASFVRKAITVSPFYAARQLFRDSVAAPMTSGADFMPVLGALREIGSASGDVLSARGVTGGQQFTGTQEDISGVLRRIAGGKQNFAIQAFAKMENLAMQADALTRRAQYNSYIRQGLSEMEATLMSLESMNFTKRGMSPTVHIANSLVPFFNAQIQGLNVLYKAMTGKMPMNEKLNIQRKFYVKGAMLMATAIAYAAYMQDDEAYKNAPPDTKYNNFFIRIPGFEEPIKLPVPFEVGYIFKSLPEAIYNMMTGDEQAQRDALKGLNGIIINTIPGGSSMMSFEIGGAEVPVPVPVPQAIKPLAEMYANKSFFSRQPLISQREAMRDPGYQFRESTTELVKMFGETTGLSPIQTENLIRGYTGSLPLLGLAIVSSVIPGDPGAPTAAEKPLSKWPGLSTLFQDNYASAAISGAYDKMAEYQKVRNTVRQLVQDGYVAKAQELLERESEKFARAAMADNYKAQMSKLTQAMRAIRASQLPPEEKRARLQEVQQARLALSRAFVGAE